MAATKSQSPVKQSKGHNVTDARMRSCSTKTFLLDYRYKACVPGIKHQVVEMAINDGSGIRDTGQVLGINKNTVISTLKKTALTYPGNSYRA